MSPTTLEEKREVAVPLASVAPAEPFEQREEAAFHADDRHAAAAIAGIMVAILSGGLLLYIFIACWVLAYPM
jgi:hypothetical protein